MNKIYLIIVLVVCVCLSCNKDSENEIEKIFEEENNILEKIVATEATNVGYDYFQANWNNIDSSIYYHLELSIDYNFNIIKSEIDLTDNFHLFKDLKPDSIYFFRVKYFTSDLVSDYSNVIKVRPNRENISVSFLTHDNITLKGEIYKKIEIENKAPIVIFLHEGASDRSEWVNNEFFERYVDSGFVSFAFDVTGHGESGGVIDWDQFRIDTNILPADFKAALKYIQNLDYTDSNNIGVYGGSMGAFMGVGASSFPEIKTVVALTCPYQHIINLYDTTNINSVFYIVGENDGTFPEDMQKLYNLTKEPKKLTIIEGSSQHGVTLLFSSKELKEEAFLWVYNSLTN